MPIRRQVRSSRTLPAHTVPPTVVVTGCSSGIGAATARLLAADGFHVLAGVRDMAVGRSLAAGHPLIEPIRLDVTDEEHLEAFADRLDELPNGLAGLVNNAGIVNVGPIEALPQTRWEEAIAVNVLGTIAVTRIATPAVIAGRGRIINVSSPVARVSIPMLGPYAVTKAAMAAFNDTLRRELFETGVKVIEVTPGPVATPIFDKGVADGVGMMQYGHPEYRDRYGAMAHSAIEAGRKSATDGAPPEQTASAIVRTLTKRRPRLHIYLGAENRVVGVITRVVPARIADALIVRVTRSKNWKQDPELQLLPDAASFYEAGSTAIVARVTPAAEAFWASTRPRERSAIRSARQRNYVG